MRRPEFVVVVAVTLLSLAIASSAQDFPPDPPAERLPSSSPKTVEPSNAPPAASSEDGKERGAISPASKAAFYTDSKSVNPRNPTDPESAFKRIEEESQPSATQDAVQPVPGSADDRRDRDAPLSDATATPIDDEDFDTLADGPVQSDEHDAPELFDSPDEQPSAFWLDGTSRTPLDRDDSPTIDSRTIDTEAVVRPTDDPADFGPPAPDPDANEFGVSPMAILDTTIMPATRQRLSWTTGQSFAGSVMETPVIVIHGIKPGPRLCLTAGVHGDELNGVEVVRRLAYAIEPEDLAGTVIAVPIVNLLGFSRGSRYLPDRRDLNRFFPGSPYGSSASRIAHSFFRTIINHCDALVDFHTGSLDRANLPQVRGDLTIPSVVEFTRGFGATAVLHSPGALGMLRYAASTHGVPSVTFEIGGPMRLQPEEIEHGQQAIESLMHKMGMVERRRLWAEPQAVFYESTWVRVDQGGMLFSEVKLGDRVTAGQRLGRVIDPVSNRSAEVLVPENGRVIGMALNQLVLPGFAAYHLGVAASEERVVNEAEQAAAQDDERFVEYDQLDEDADPDAGPPGEVRQRPREVKPSDEPMED